MCRQGLNNGVYKQMVASGSEDADTFAKATVKGAHSSFYWAMRLLPSKKRSAMYAIYAFCRIVDDIADNPGNIGKKRKQLQLWRDEIASTCEGRPTGPIGRALAGARARFGLRQGDFLAIIDGMEMDVGVGAQDAQVRIADMEELKLYCDRVAGAVGRLSNQVFGLESGRGDRLADSLGRALQLTNILRDLKEDASRNRLYLPVDLLKRHGIDDINPVSVLASATLPAICAEIAAIADKDFNDAETLMVGLKRSQIRPVIIMKDIYKPVLHRLIKGRWKDLNKSVCLSRLRRLWIVVRSGVIGP